MNSVRSQSRAIRYRSAGFSMVEMIGVLAIIAILAVIIVPKVFSTIASARVTNAVASVTSMQSAVTDFGGKYGSVPLTVATSRIDDLLVTAGILNSRFMVKLGTQPPAPPPAGASWSNTTGAWVADTTGAVTAIGEIATIITTINDYQLTIASAVEEQTATTNEMSRNVAEASTGSDEIATNISTVASAADTTTQAVSQTLSAIEELARMAQDLQTEVGRFTIA